MEFLLKSSLCMMVLLTIYHLFLEREKMHRFNRFYLLFALIFSLAVPFVAIEIEPNEVINPIAATGMIFEKTNTPSGQSISPEIPTDYFAIIAWSLYGLITFLLLIRFAVNIGHFVKKVNKNPLLKYGSATLVLVPEKVLPHTFLNYIFINREDHETNAVENELYTHELTHVKQKHTIDILFIEILKAVLWFNPLLYFYKKAIQLNHEFLADEKVVSSFDNAVFYQKLLLEKAAIGNPFYLASNLNFLLTKKRLLMMTKTTSKTKSSLLKLAVTPVLGALMILLCTKTIAQERIKPSEIQNAQIEVTTVTKNELDSLQKANPIKYKGKEVDFLKTKIRYAEKRDEHKNSVSFEKKQEYTLNLSGAVTTDPSKIKSIEILQLTPTEIDSLKKIDAVTYNDTAIKEYVAIKIMQMNDRGQIETLTTYERKPKNENN
jgi:hypothetical protein